MFGIEDPQVWGAYLLCLISAAFCLFYGLLNWDKGDEQVHSEDKDWVEAEKKVEDTL